MLDFLSDGLISIIEYLYNMLGGQVVEIFELAGQSPEAFNYTIWSKVVEFNEVCVLPVAWSVLSAFLLMELVSLFKRADTKGVDSVYWVCIVLLKIMLAKMMMDNMNLIINAVFEMTNDIMVNGTGLLKVQDLTVSVSGLEGLEDALDDIGFLSILASFVVTVFLMIFAKIGFVLAKLVVILRFVEIYAWSSICALPFATLPSQEYGSIGKNYIKRMTALALQGVFISIVIWIYFQLVKTYGLSFEANENPLVTVLGVFDNLVYIILLVIALFQTAGWSKSLVQAN